VYDTENGMLYVVNTGAHDVSVIDHNRVVGTVPVGGNPGFPTFNPHDGVVYVPNAATDNVSVLVGARVIASVGVGMGPRFATYDAANRNVYVSDFYSDDVSVITGTSFDALVDVGSGPLFEAYDSGNGFVYVENSAANDVSILNGTTVVGTVSVGGFPHASAYDPGNGFLYVPNFNSNTVSVLDGTSSLATVDVGTEPVDAAYDDESGDVYVTNYGSNDVSVLNGTRVVGRVAVGSEPLYAAYDAGLGEFFVPNDASDNVSVLAGTHVIASVSVGSLPEYATYDDGNGDVYVSNSGSGNVSVLLAPHGYSATFRETGLSPGNPWSVLLNGTFLTTTWSNLTFAEANGTYPFTVGSVGGMGTDPSTGSVSVTGASVAIPLTFAFQPAYSVTFTEVGLPTRANWSVILGGVRQWTTTTTIAFEAPSGVVAYSVGVVPGWTTPSFQGLVIVNGSAMELGVSWTQLTYSVTFRENGLPVGAWWWVQVDGGPMASSGTSELGFFLPNGTYEYSVFAFDQPYSAAGGSFEVTGAPVSLPAPFVASPYAVTFAETGLAIGTNWSVTVDGDTVFSTGTSIVFPEANGTYVYIIGRLPGWTTPTFAGSVAVNGGPVLKPVPWVQVAYPVTFTEQGLAKGTEWWVNVTGGAPGYSSTGEVVLNEPNGSYTYTAATIDQDYASAPGSFGINGTAYFVSVRFLPVTFVVVFWETGLPFGTNWSVTADGVTAQRTNDTLTLELGNGTYPFSVGPVTGYTAAPSTGTVSVRGGPASEVVTFSRNTATFLGFPPWEGYAMLGGIPAATFVAILAWGLWRRSRRRPSAP
jgi:YVTN family beta-propeller protein